MMRNIPPRPFLSGNDRISEINTNAPKNDVAHIVERQVINMV